jgi:chemotaxis receptor (MCP) glutamine deamidase CheD
VADNKIKLLQHAVARSGRLVIDHIGSRVGIMLYSSSRRTGAGLHVLALSSSGLSPKNPIMYADTAVPFIIKELQAKGATPSFSVAIAGGAGLLNMGTGLDGLQYNLDQEAIAQLGIQEDDIREIMHQVVESVQEITEEM